MIVCFLFFSPPWLLASSLWALRLPFLNETRAASYPGFCHPAVSFLKYTLIVIQWSSWANLAPSTEELIITWGIKKVLGKRHIWKIWGMGRRRVKRSEVYFWNVLKKRRKNLILNLLILGRLWMSCGFQAYCPRGPPTPVQRQGSHLACFASSDTWKQPTTANLHCIGSSGEKVPTRGAACQAKSMDCNALLVQVGFNPSAVFSMPLTSWKLPPKLMSSGEPC